MGKKAIISKHIILTGNPHSNMPAYGIILIEDEIINDTILIDLSVPVSSVMEKYIDWNPEDLSEFYISPGLIDLNTRLEWETYTELTKASISGGVTVVLVESGYYNESSSSGKMFCDIGKVATLEISTIETIQFMEDQGFLAVKGYFFPPNNTVQCIPTNLEFIFEEISKTHLTFILDPNLPDPRMLHSVSPYRFTDLKNRLLKDTQDLKSFSGAFPDLIESGDESSDSDDIPLPSLNTRRSVIEPMDRVNEKDFSPDPMQKKNSRNTTELVLEISKLKEIDPDYAFMVERNLKHQKTYTIWEDLNKRIKNSQLSIRTLSLAEIETYKEAGVTQYTEVSTMKPSAIKPPVQISAPSSLQRRKPKGLSLDVKTVSKKENVYNIHMANYSHTWESAGIEKVLAALKKFPFRVHISNISAASSINMIRKAKEANLKLTCEIQASHLIFSSKSIPEDDTRFKGMPPIRNQCNTNLLWDLLKLKGIDVITSGHACIDPRYKFTDGNFQKAVNGMPGVGFSLQSVWTMLNGPISKHSQLEHYIVRLAKWMSLHPAEILNISATRGSISKGKYADIVVWNPFELGIVEIEHSSFPQVSPFIGMELYGKIHQVYLRGNLAFTQGKFKARGRVLQRLNH